MLDTAHTGLGVNAFDHLVLDHNPCGQKWHLFQAVRSEAFYLLICLCNKFIPALLLILYHKKSF